MTATSQASALLGCTGEHPCTFVIINESSRAVAPPTPASLSPPMHEPPTFHQPSQCINRAPRRPFVSLPTLCKHNHAHLPPLPNHSLTSISSIPTFLFFPVCCVPAVLRPACGLRTSPLVCLTKTHPAPKLQPSVLPAATPFHPAPPSPSLLFLPYAGTVPVNRLSPLLYLRRMHPNFDSHVLRRLAYIDTCTTLYIRPSAPFISLSL